LPQRSGLESLQDSETLSGSATLQCQPPARRNPEGIAKVSREMSLIRKA